MTVVNIAPGQMGFAGEMNKPESINLHDIFRENDLLKMQITELRQSNLQLATQVSSIEMRYQSLHNDFVCVRDVLSKQEEILRRIVELLPASNTSYPADRNQSIDYLKQLTNQLLDRPFKLNNPMITPMTAFPNSHPADYFQNRAQGFPNQPEYFKPRPYEVPNPEPQQVYAQPSNTSASPFIQAGLQQSAPNAASTTFAPKPKPARSITWKSAPRVLVVDDDQVYQKLYSKYLSGLGCMYDVVGDGSDAVECIRGGKKYDIVLMVCHSRVAILV